MSRPRSRRALLAWYIAVPLATAGVLFGVLAAAGGFPGTARESLPEEAGLAPEIDQSQAVWWMWLGEEHAAVANLGPFFESRTGRTVRRWALMVHAESPEPILCFQGILDVDTDDPVSLDASSYSVQLEPAEGLTWRDVLDADQVRGKVGGLR